MLDIGWSELLLIGLVTLIVVGPKDLPLLFRSLGRITAKARAMAREFTSAMEDAAKSTGLDEASDALRDVKSMTSKKSLGLDALERAADRFEKWDPKLSGGDAPARPDPGVTRPANAPADLPAPTEVAASAAPELPAPSAAENETGPRRLHAVRRSDTKDR